MKLNETYVITGRCTYISGSIFEPFSTPYGANYFVKVAISKSDEATIQKLGAAMKKAFLSRYPTTAYPREIKCWRDGMECIPLLNPSLDSSEVLATIYEKSWVLTANTGIQRPPIVTDQDLKELVKIDNGYGFDKRFYTGSLCRLSVSAYVGPKKVRGVLTGEVKESGISLKFNLTHIMLLNEQPEPLFKRKEALLIPKGSDPSISLSGEELPENHIILGQPKQPEQLEHIEEEKDLPPWE